MDSPFYERIKAAIRAAKVKGNINRIYISRRGWERLAREHKQRSHILGLRVVHSTILSGQSFSFGSAAKLNTGIIRSPKAA